jgi:ribonuclease BN (tRNA processing enzyme)
MIIRIVRRMLVVLPAICLIGAAVPARAQSPPDKAVRTRVVLLGTGTPNADPERMGPCVAVVVDDIPYLVDAGVGLVRRAAAAQRRGVNGLAVDKLDMVFLTHLHSDHTLGLPDLWLTPWVLERSRPLRVYGPAGTRRLADHVRQAWAEDIRVRLDGLEPANPLGYKMNVTEIEAGVIYRDNRVTVEAFPVRHGAWAQAFGYRFVTPDRTIVISGDTVPVESLVEKARGCDVLVHEVYSAEAFRRRAPEWQRYHAAAHTSTTQLAEIARRVRPGLLVLYHQLYWGQTDEGLLKEITDTYDGRVVSGKDLDIF